MSRHCHKFELERRSTRLKTNHLIWYYNLLYQYRIMVPPTHRDLLREPNLLLRNRPLEVEGETLEELQPINEGG